MTGRTTPLRVMLYSHDSQGLGHTRRNTALAHALAEQLPRLTGRGVTGLLITGLDDVVDALPTGFDAVRLPAIRKSERRYAPRHLDVPMDDLISLRSRMLTGAVLGFAPDLFIIDRHVYGVDGELRATLRRLRAEHPATKVVLGLRDVLDSPEVVAAEWQALGDLGDLRGLIDAIWIYGDAHVHDLRRTGEVPADLADLVHHTGYLSAGRRTPPTFRDERGPYVLTMVGGGSDGLALCLAAAAAPVPRGVRHVVVTGPQMAPAEHRQVVRAATARTEVLTQVPDGLASIREALAVVAMAGYNTVCEVMSTTTPALLVPRETPRLEQTIRARGLAARGAVDLCSPGEVTPDRIGGWLARAVTGGPVRARAALDLRGLAGVPRLAAELLELPRPDRAPAPSPAARAEHRSATSSDVRTEQTVAV